MFGKKKGVAGSLEGPYKVDAVAGKGRLEKLLNQRHAEGYDLIAILQNEAWGSNLGRDVVFKKRESSA